MQSLYSANTIRRSSVAELEPALQELDVLDGCGYHGGGELQLSPDASELAYYHHRKYISGFQHRQSYIHVMNLASNRISINGQSQTYACDTLYGNFGNGMFSYNRNGEEIVFEEHPVVKRFAEDTINTYLRKIKPLESGELFDMLTSGIIIGDLFRGLDGRIYLSQNKASGHYDNAWLYSFTEDIAGSYIQDSLPVYGSNNSSVLEGGFPSQVVKAFGSSAGGDFQTVYSRNLGNKVYEVVDHLGNIRAVVGDQRYLMNTGDATSYETSDLLYPDVKSINDYYPFGMISRSVNPQTYRFGFNGMEKDPEITGQQGSHYTAAFWEYDTRIARRWNLDPVDKPWESSYLAFSGNPILLGDPNGDNADWFQNEKTGKVFYHPELREGDEGTLGMEGEGWVHMGENGMFGVDFSGSPPENMINPGEYGTGSDWSHIHESGSGTWLYDFRAVNPDDSEFVWENKFEGVLFTPEEASEFMGDHGYEFKATTRVISEGHHNTIAETQHLDYSGESIISVSDYRYINYKGYWNKDYYLGSNHPTADTRSQNVQYSDRYREKLEKSKKRTGNIFMRLIAEVVKVFKK